MDVLADSPFALMPNEVVSLFFEHMSENQRLAISRVCKIWQILTYSFPAEGTIENISKESSKRIFSNLKNDDLRAIAKIISQGGSKDIKHIEIRDSEIREFGFEIILNALKENKNIKKFTLTNCQMPILCISNAMKIINNPNYIIFHVNGGTLLKGVYSVSDLEAYLYACRFQIRLNLENKQITNREVAVLARYLEADRRFRIIDLDNNCIGDDGLLCLCEALTLNDTVETIWLHKNNITIAGMLAVDEFNKKYRLFGRLFGKYYF